MKEDTDFGLTYEPLRILFVKRNIKTTAWAKDIGLAPSTMSKLMNDRPVMTDVLDRVCKALDVELDQIVERKKGAAEE